jgi:hypothetical protein
MLRRYMPPDEFSTLARGLLSKEDYESVLKTAMTPEQMKADLQK